MSAEYVDAPVEERLRHPRRGERMLVAVGASDDVAALEDHVRDLDANVEIRRKLPYDTLRLSIPETALGELCELPGVETVEAEERVRPHDEGN